MLCFCYKAGKKTTDEELEEMLESGNPAIFTSGVSDSGAGVYASPQRREATGSSIRVAGDGWAAGAGRQGM